MSDQQEPQDLAEALDADKIADLDYPPDEPLGADEPEVTPRGERTDESFEERDARHEPEDETADAPVVRPIHEASEDYLDEEGQVVARAEVGGDAELDSAPAPAEEAAMHVEDA